MILQKRTLLFILSLVHASAYLIAGQQKEEPVTTIETIPQQAVQKKYAKKFGIITNSQTKNRIWDLKKLQIIAHHEGGHTTQIIKHSNNMLNLGFVTILDQKILDNCSLGHVQALPITNASTKSECVNEDKNYISENMRAIIPEIKWYLGGPAADHVFNNKQPFNTKNEIIEYLKNPHYESDTENAKRRISLLLMLDRMSLLEQAHTATNQSGQKPLSPKQQDKELEINDILAAMYQQTYADQLEQKENTAKLGASLLKFKTLTADKIYRELNTYPNQIITAEELALKKNYTEKQFYQSGELYSKARFKDGKLTNVAFYQQDGVRLPKYFMNKGNKASLLLKTYSKTKITTQEHKLNGQPIIGPAISKNYKYGYDNNLQYVGHKGKLDKNGRTRKDNFEQHDYSYNNNLQKVDEGTQGEFNVFGRNRHGNLAVLD